MDKTERYNILFEHMIDTMTTPYDFDREEFVSVLKEFCELFNLSKGVTEFYPSLSAEKDGEGEVFIDYDNGHGDKVAIYRRIITPSKTVIKSTIYMAADAEPLSDEEYRRVDLIIRAMLSFISRNRLQSAVEKLAFYDEQGYPNLNSFMRRLEVMDEKGILGGNTAVQFNLCHFSLVNQELGRLAGDTVMRNYFDLIREFIGESGMICRVGGDNFAAIFKNNLLKFVLSILSGFPVPYEEDREKRINVSAYVGVFVIPDDFVFERPGDIFNRILPAANDAKLEHTDNVVYYDDGSVAGKEKIMRIRRDFTEAVEKHEFKAYYQPKVDIKTGKIIGAEALCRWIKDGKIVPPSEFIPVLEQNTDICRLDMYMLDSVCKDIRRWLDEGKDVVRISVNLSRKHLIDVDLFDHILSVIDANNVPHKYIELELTETTTEVGFKKLKYIVNGLREAGIHMAIDDFGVGYSSLNLIREISWDVIKLDRSLLPDENVNSTVSEMMFGHIVSIVNSMGLECVAEGVETKKHLDLLQKSGCSVAQGFIFDKPLPVTDFEQKLSGFRYQQR